MSAIGGALQQWRNLQRFDRAYASTIGLGRVNVFPAPIMDPPFPAAIKLAGAQQEVRK